ncbi:Gar1/Naf1 RNA binding region-domain-containing protein [Phakopsora pachyrhizi]|uniref:H/ACA ribonucleoprotein complex non-core subunit NAF1 n=1 Tax=Phakopsora pachyrhizi TaxID=170000 RepID=A0AAV0BK46_PHAPC|nr:Gar1/Naf1 RNA binding region-domain-containing protein [Phakopsora pachyrhizi]CAH7687607.1 Gar1/Naf1 RNA binding region-domain-containing protein [Phakopsora pachyrhizi]
MAVLMEQIDASTDTPAESAQAKLQLAASIPQYVTDGETSRLDLDRIIEERIVQVTNSAFKPDIEGPSLLKLKPTISEPSYTTPKLSIEFQPKVKESLFSTGNSSSSYQAHSQNNIPQDILHILESNFTSTSTSSEEIDQKELSRVAEELRCKVRLSRYKRTQGEQIGAEDEESEGSSEETETETETEDDESGESDDNELAEESEDEEADQADIKRLLKAESDESSKLISESISQQPIIETGSKSELATEDRAPQSSPSAVDSFLESLKLPLPPQAHDCAIVQNASRKSEDNVTKNKSRSRRRARRKGPKSGKAEDTHLSESQSEDFDCDELGPKTANELKDVPEEISELLFTQTSDEDLKTIRPFGTIVSIIGNVVVIKGASGLGYDKVLDEGSMVCQESGLVIGKVFETFGSVSDPHYSIRLPVKSQSQQNSQAENPPLTPNQCAYYIPKYTQFVFTSELEAQPKGTDASNIFDEEISNADEIAFSDDEAEAAYLRACKLARKVAAGEKKGSAQQFSKTTKPHTKARDTQGQRASKNSVLESPRNQSQSDILNYDDKAPSETDGYDYKVLERPKGAPIQIAPNFQVMNTERRGAPKRGKNSRNGLHGAFGAKPQRKQLVQNSPKPLGFQQREVTEATGSNSMSGLPLNFGSRSSPISYEASAFNHRNENLINSPLPLNRSHPFQQSFSPINSFNPMGSTIPAPFQASFPPNNSFNFTPSPSYFYPPLGHQNPPMQLPSQSTCYQPAMNNTEFYIPHINPVNPQFNFSFQPFSSPNQSFNPIPQSPFNQNPPHANYQQSNTNHNP